MAAAPPSGAALAAARPARWGADGVPRSAECLWMARCMGNAAMTLADIDFACVRVRICAGDDVCGDSDGEAYEIPLLPHLFFSVLKP